MSLQHFLEGACWLQDESHVEGLDYSLVGAALMAGVGDGMELEHDAGTGRFVLCQRLSFEQLRALLVRPSLNPIIRCAI